jgi:hypothetical protein
MDLERIALLIDIGKKTDLDFFLRRSPDVIHDPRLSKIDLDTRELTPED